MNRLLRTPAAGLAALALVVLTAGACSYVEPPVMTITRDGESAPFYTLTQEDLRSELAGPSLDAGPTTTAGARTTMTEVTNVLVAKFRNEIWKELLAGVGTAINQTDRDIARQQLQSSGGSAGEDALEAIASSEAYGRGLAEEEFRSGRVDAERAAREYFDRNPAAFSSTAQLCLHGMAFIDQAARPGPNGEIDTSGAVAQANTARARLGGESFEQVNAALAAAEWREQYPQGDLGCIAESNLARSFPADVIERLRAAGPGTVVDPVPDEAQPVAYLFRVDEVRPARTPPFDDVRANARDLAARSLGRELANQGLLAAVQKFDVYVDPRYGRFEPGNPQILGPDPAMTPTTPTTPTTVFDPGLLPTEEPAAPTTTTTSAPPGTTPGTTPGTGPAPADGSATASPGTTATTAGP